LTEVRQIVRDLEQAEARGEDQWYTMDQIREFQRQLLEERESAAGNTPATSSE